MISKEERGENWRTLEEWRGVYLAQKRAGHDKVYLEQSRYILDAADSEKAELQKENRRVVEGAAREGSDAEAELAPALGYEYDEEYGWVTGDHTSVTLAMEARWKIAELRQENDRLNQTLASIIVSNDPPTQADIDRAHELVERGEIEDG